MTVLCLAGMWLAGFGFVRWMFPQPLRWSLHNIWLFSMAVGAGAGIASCLYFATLLLAGSSRASLALVTGAALVIALALSWLSRPRASELQWADGAADHSNVPWYVTAFFVVAAALALTMFVGAVAYNPHGDEGAWSIWNLRARFLFRAGALWRDAFSSDLNWTHPDYPLLVPGLVALGWKLAGQESSDSPIAIAFLFALGTAGVLVSTLGALRGKLLALLAGTLLLGTASFIALSAALYGDVPLSFYILSTLALLCLQDRHPENLRFTAVAGFMAGLAAWARNEGVIFVIALIIARAIVLFRGRKGSPVVPQLLRLLIGLAAPLAVVVTFKLRVAGASDLLSTPPSTLIKHIADPTRWIMLAEGFVIVLFTLGRFVLPIVLVLALYWYLVRFRVDERDGTALATGGLALALMLAGELLVDLVYAGNLPVEISTSFERIFLQLWPAALLLFFLASAPLQLVAPKTQKKAAKPGRRAVEAR